LRSQPREEGDLLIAASNGLIVGYDNLSTLPDWLSDALCRLTSGAGLSKRQLYADVDEVVLAARRPVILTGIESVLSRGDAIDRALLVELQPIAKGKRRTDQEVWAAFEAARPGILGALCGAASTALRNVPTTHIAELPRLADFTVWVEAAAPALGWASGRFLTIYNHNRDSADEIAVDASPIGPTVRAFLSGLKEGNVWEGTASELLAALNECASEATKKEKDWPKRANTVSGQLKRIAPHLRRLGYIVRLGEREGRNRRRVIHLATGSARDRPHRPQDENQQNDADSCGRSDRPPSSAEGQESSAHRPRPDEKNQRNDADLLGNGDDADDVDDVDDALRHSWGGATQQMFAEYAECPDCGHIMDAGMTLCADCRTR
jgi:hypothetical protein